MEKGTVYVIGNFKGGVGKTKTATMLSYVASQHKKEKILLIDMDPQGNSTSILAKTGNITEIDKNVTDGFLDGDLNSQIIPILENLDIIPASTNFRNLPKILMKKFPEDEKKQILYFKELIKPLKEKYDRIYIDVPPTISDFSDSAMLASDFCIIILQTQELSLDGAKTYIAYMQYLADTYDNQLNVVGLVPMMLRKSGRVDKKIINEARALYGGNVIDTIVTYQERLKVYDSEGIRYNVNIDGRVDMWDKRSHEVFLKVLDELDDNESALRNMLN